MTRFFFVPFFYCKEVRNWNLKYKPMIPVQLGCTVLLIARYLEENWRNSSGLLVKVIGDGYSLEPATSLSFMHEKKEKKDNEMTGNVYEQTVLFVLPDP